MAEWHNAARGSSRRHFLKASGAAGALALAGCSSGGGGGGGSGTGTGTDSGTTTTALSDSMTIFHAGSLEPPFSSVESQFESEYGVDVAREAKGSVGSTRKITQQGRQASVLGVSDYRLIRDRMVPEFADWYAIFQSNAVTLHYTSDSTGAGDMSKDNWWNVLSRDDVEIGHSDPANDPGGYRAKMMLQLGKEEFDGETLYDESTYQAMEENAGVKTGTETKLVGQLQSGKLDYAINYKSVGTTADVKVQDLQPAVDLSKVNSKYAQHYQKATVETSAGTFTGAPIAYGVTVPSNAPAPGLGNRWVESLLSEDGRTVQKNKGFVPVDPGVVPASMEGSVPQRVMENATAKESLGPLALESSTTTTS
jgi:molybdate/tungstate transport system substrate-binding protein